MLRTQRTHGHTHRPSRSPVVRLGDRAVAVTAGSQVSSHLSPSVIRPVTFHELPRLDRQQRVVARYHLNLEVSPASEGALAGVVTVEVGPSLNLAVSHVVHFVYTPHPRVLPSM